METQVKNDIKNNLIKNAYVFYGEERYLTDYYCNEIIKLCVDDDTKEFNYLKISSSLPPEEEIDAFASSYPFMSEKKILHIQDTGIFKSASEGHKKYFEELLSNPPEYLTVLFAESKIDKKTSLYKLARKLCTICEFNYKAPNDLAVWLSAFFKRNGKEIDSKDCIYMCEIGGPSMLTLKSEAQKLITFLGDKNKVTRELIDTLVTKTVENRVFDMINDLTLGNRQGAMSKLSDLKALDEEPIKIISIIFKKFAGLHSAFILKNKSTAEIARTTSTQEWIVKNNLKQANKLGARKIASVMTKCRDMDFGIKNGSVDKWLTIEFIISEIIL